MHEFLAQNRKAGEKLVILEIPLLFETGKDYPLDKIAVTFCDDEIKN